MASQISTTDLVKKAKQFITSDAKDPVLRALIRTAVINADRELREADSLSPLAWDIVPYDELRTCTYAKISAITQASPGVITAASVDSDITGHGFHNNSSYHQDIVLIDGITGMEELNGRFFLLEYLGATTFSLKSLDGITAINTSGYTAYSSGGSVYHAGFVLKTATILTGITTWDFKRVIPSPTFDGYPTKPIAEQLVKGSRSWTDFNQARRPVRFRYWRNMTAATTSSHYLFWYPVCNQQYNVMVPYQKEVPDISTWAGSTYPFHPPEAHDCLWHGALAILVGENTRMKRSSEKFIAIKMEILFAEKWMRQWAKDKARIVRLSRKMMGAMGGQGGISA
jgi:hypothetical protein